VTRAAFVLALGLVLTRATMLEILRDALDVAPGAQPTPVAPGPGTSLVLDLIAWVPALLVLARAAFDRSYVIRFAWTHLLLITLAIWAVLSTIWASDKFAAVVSGFHFLSAAVLLWSATQLVRSWKRLRIVAGVCVAILLLHAAQAMSYRFVDLPDIRKDWQAHREEHLRNRGLEPGSFAAQSFEAKLLRGELMGFHASPNSFAAVTVMLMVIAAGVVMQRLRNKDGIGWVVVPIAGIGLGFAIIVWADSKTAYATPVLAGMVFAVLALRGNWLARHAKLAYFAGVACFVLGALAVVGHGMRHGSLVIDSLTFRWRYWVGAAHIIASHPILGVGWENFGLHYLSARLPIAAEEVRDPHNFIVRFTSELGLVGGVLAVAFMLRLWWDATRPRVPEQPEDERRSTAAIPTVVAVLATGFVLNVLATVDFGFMSAGGSEGPAYVFLKLLERAAGAILVLVGMFATITRALPEADVDDRPAPWVLYGILTGLGVFLLHNLVDFSLFEAGPMFLFALLAGSALGMRQEANAPAAPRRVTLIMAAIAPVAWLVAAAALAAPVLIAESSADAGDEAVRTSRFEQAIQAYQDAAATVPYNGEYSFRAGRILGSARGDAAAADRARAAFDAAIRANPLSAAYLATRADFESRQPQPDPARIRKDFERSLALDPENVQTRLEYAGALAALHFPADAREQYEKALWYDDQLAPDEIERLSAGKVAEIRANIARLQPPTTAPSTRPM
jgi:O-antigen ligase/tetratricopeptide (TPR) repeat protein